MRALESKALRGERDNRNRWKIALEDLEEWAKNRPAIDRSLSDDMPDNDHDETGHVREELASARAEIDGLHDRISDLRLQIDDLKGDKERLAELLKEAMDLNRELQRRPAVGILRRLFGR